MKKDEEDVEGGEEAGSEERKMKSVLLIFCRELFTCSPKLLASA